MWDLLVNDSLPIKECFSPREERLPQNKYTLKSVTIINNNCFHSCRQKDTYALLVLINGWLKLSSNKEVTLALPNVADVFLSEAGFSILLFPLDLPVHPQPQHLVCIATILSSSICGPGRVLRP